MASYTKQVPGERIRFPTAPMLFPEVPGAKRQYPGARQGNFLVGYLNRLSPQKQVAFLKGLSRLVKPFVEGGLAIRPTSDEGKAALAALILADESRLSRIRPCLHCRTWFYARQERQRFCSDRAKRCQWKHYHSPEWRKRNREQNRKHQRAYRERLFGKRR